ncbi:DoxX family protein [Deminuibacter soli]|uniref:DoxX family protein n=1 Tax=Deminuibacter soli TaxID=2291815 RepID=A0A3E1NEV2_9BACT|nr:DoxX family protein [Deminuibacter soli]RFM26515.1 DoxX family protein [Deminuibacter soli]
MPVLQNIRAHSLHQPRWLTLLRIALGALLFIKGIAFISDSSRLETLLQGTRLAHANTALLSGVITWAHLLGGFFILIGLMTRIMSILQIPILLGAIFIVNLPHFTMNNGSELALAVITLVLLVVFVIEGSGRISADEYFRTYYKAGLNNNIQL